MKIDSQFCGGAIEVVQAERPTQIELKIPKDSLSCTRQWFYFAVETEQPKAHHIRIINAGDVSFPSAWQRYEVFASYDNQKWFSLPTQFDGQSLTFDHAATSTRTYYAYFVPYTLERTEQVASTLSSQSHITKNTIAATANGNSLDLFSFGDIADHKKNVWIIARQHPGETMAQWIAEGIANSFADIEHCKAFYSEFNLFIVMNMNPDGSEIGNHRTNALGHNLNRCWSQPTKEACPEVHAVQHEMRKQGVDFFIDIHGDESIPYNFMMSLSKNAKDEKFKQMLADMDPRFQLKFDYDTYQNSCTSSCGASTCGIGKTATSYVARTFNATSLLLEASFKQLKNRPSNETWDQKSCITLGHSIADSIRAFLSAQYS